jgi:hypothetical protein
MFRAPETLKKDRSCGRQVLSAITTMFTSDEPEHPIPMVPLHEISSLFAPRTDQQAKPLPPCPQTIPIISLYNISPLFVRPQDREAGPPSQRSDIEFPFPYPAKVCLPRYPQPVKLKQPRRPVLCRKDSFRDRARGANLEPVVDGLADKYYQPMRSDPLIQHTEHTEFPFSNMNGQCANTGTSKSLPPLPVDNDDGWSTCDTFPAGQVDHHGNHEGIPMVWQGKQRRSLSGCSSVSEVDCQDIDTIAIAQPTPRRMILSDCSSQRSPASTISSEAVESDWDDEEVDLFVAKNKFRSRHLAVADRNSALDICSDLSKAPGRVLVLFEASKRISMTAELCCASDSEDEDEVVESPRRDSFSVENASQVAGDWDAPAFVDLDGIDCVEDSGIPGEWSALLHASDDQACLTRFAHIWNEHAEPIDQSLFVGFDGDFTTSVAEHRTESLMQLSNGREGLCAGRPASERFISLPTTDSLREVFLRRNREDPDEESPGDSRPEVLFMNFYKFRTGRSF